MKINKQELQNALEKVKPGLANKEIVEQSTSFAFLGDKIVTYNDEISISQELKLESEITGAINASEFYQCISKIKAAEIDLSVSPKGILITAGKSTMAFVLQKNIKLPLLNIGKKKKWNHINEELIQAIRFCLGSCSTDMSRPILTCVHLNEEGVVESSDNFRISRCVLEENCIPQNILIPARSAVEIVKLKPTTMLIEKEWIHFKNADNTIISCRTYQDDYVDLTPLLEIEGIDLVFPRTLTEIIDRATVLAKRDYILDSFITVIIENNRIKIRSTSENGSWFEEEANIRYKDERLIFKISPHLIKDILNVTTCCVISESKIKFSANNWEYVSVLTELIN